MVANAAQVQCRPCGNSPPGRGAGSIRSRIHPRGRAFRTRRASSTRTGAAGGRARFGAHCGSGNPSHTAGASAASEIPAGLGNACLRAFGAAVRTLFDSERIRFAAGRRSARADRDQVEQAYQAFQRNDLGAARESYQRALAREPTNRDALLGLAAIDVRNGQLGSAEARYLKLLEIDPRDSHAVANLITLRGQLDPVASESRLKSLIATQPETALLHFSLGNQYAQQSRWAEAQSAYFKAYSVDPENADYAFNLAVSLDQLHQGKLALEYYRRALALTEKRAASFTPAQARLRVQELSK